jgi:hypothetical protein
VLVKTFVLLSAFLLMVAGALSDGTDRVYDLLMAVFWTALLAVVWELGARALARARRKPDTAA